MVCVWYRLLNLYGCITFLLGLFCGVFLLMFARTSCKSYTNDYGHGGGDDSCSEFVFVAWGAV